MTVRTQQPILANAKALVSGIANEHSIAYGCAKAFHDVGAEVALTYANDKARQYVEPVAQELASPIFLPLDVCNEAEMERLFREIRAKWGKLDILLHSVAWARRLTCRAAC